MSRYYSDNPVRDADRYLDDEMEFSQSLPVCHGCGDSIAGEYSYPVGDHLYCQDCWEELLDDLTAKHRVRTENFMEG